MEFLDELHPVIFQEVYGFALAESTGEPTSALQKMLGRIKLRYPRYVNAVFICKGSLHSVMSWHRLYVVFVHEHCGGEITITMAKKLIKARIFNE